MQKFQGRIYAPTSGSSANTHSGHHHYTQPSAAAASQRRAGSIEHSSSPSFAVVVEPRPLYVLDSKVKVQLRRSDPLSPLQSPPKRKAASPPHLKSVALKSKDNDGAGGVTTRRKPSPHHYGPSHMHQRQIQMQHQTQILSLVESESKYRQHIDKLEHTTRVLNFANTAGESLIPFIRLSHSEVERRDVIHQSEAIEWGNLISLHRVVNDLAEKRNYLLSAEKDHHMLRAVGLLAERENLARNSLSTEENIQRKHLIRLHICCHADVVASAERYKMTSPSRGMRSVSSQAVPSYTTGTQSPQRQTTVTTTSFTYLPNVFSSPPPQQQQHASPKSILKSRSRGSGQNNNGGDEFPFGETPSIIVSPPSPKTVSPATPPPSFLKESTPSPQHTQHQHQRLFPNRSHSQPSPKHTTSIERSKSPVTSRPKIPEDTVLKLREAIRVFTEGMEDFPSHQSNRHATNNERTPSPPRQGDWVVVSPIVSNSTQSKASRPRTNTKEEEAEEEEEEERRYASQSLSAERRRVSGGILPPVMTPRSPPQTWTEINEDFAPPKYDGNDGIPSPRVAGISPHTYGIQLLAESLWDSALFEKEDIHENWARDMLEYAIAWEEERRWDVESSWMNGISNLRVTNEVMKQEMVHRNDIVYAWNIHRVGMFVHYEHIRRLGIENKWLSTTYEWRDAKERMLTSLMNLHNQQQQLQLLSLPPSTASSFASSVSLHITSDDDDHHQAHQHQQPHHHLYGKAKQQSTSRSQSVGGVPTRPPPPPPTHNKEKHHTTTTKPSIDSTSTATTVNRAAATMSIQQGNNNNPPPFVSRVKNGKNDTPISNPVPTRGGGGRIRSTQTDDGDDDDDGVETTKKSQHKPPQTAASSSTQTTPSLKPINTIPPPRASSAPRTRSPSPNKYNNNITASSPSRSTASVARLHDQPSATYFDIARSKPLSQQQRVLQNVEHLTQSAMHRLVYNQIRQREIAQQQLDRLQAIKQSHRVQQESLGTKESKERSQIEVEQVQEFHEVCRTWISRRYKLIQRAARTVAVEPPSSTSSKGLLTQSHNKTNKSSSFTSSSSSVSFAPSSTKHHQRMQRVDNIDRISPIRPQSSPGEETYYHGTQHNNVSYPVDPIPIPASVTLEDQWQSWLTSWKRELKREGLGSPLHGVV